MSFPGSLLPRPSSGRCAASSGMPWRDFRCARQKIVSPRLILFYRFPVKHDWTEPPTNETGGHWISWQRVRCNKRGGELAGIAPRGDGLLVPRELREGKLPGETLLLSTSATALNKKEILFWPCTEISSKEIICSASSVIFMKI